MILAPEHNYFTLENFWFTFTYFFFSSPLIGRLFKVLVYDRGILPNLIIKYLVKDLKEVQAVSIR